MGLGEKTASSISCSICLEDVTDYGDRAWAKLQCGHQFHLDCIGSAFNVKGVMQCPNCRKIEKGQWLYADGGRPYPELNIDDLVNDDLYDPIYSESSFWCPFGGFTRLAAAFDEGEFPTTAYHDLVGQHGVFGDHTTVPSATHICPYITYVHPSSSSTVADAPTYNNSNNNNNNNNNSNQWNGQSASNEMPNSYAFPTMDVHSLFQTSSSRVGGADHPSMPRRPPRTNADMPRSGSNAHSFIVAQSGGTRGGSSVGSSMIHPYPGSAARARERSQALEAYFQQPSNLGRSNVGQVGSAVEESVYYLERDGHGYPGEGWGPVGFRQWQISPPSQQSPYQSFS